MNVLITGGTGFVGSRLSGALVARGDVVTVVSRDPAGAARRGMRGVTYRGWLPELEGYQGVVNLAGEPIFGRRWNAAVKAELRESRLHATGRLVEAMRSSPSPPSAFVSASAIGYYGDRGDELLPEDAAPGDDFMASLCRDWEGAAMAAPTRTVTTRFGVVLGEGGGALQQMLPFFRLGVGGPIGLGRQWMSWVHIDDVVALILRGLDDVTLRGPVNATAPGVVRNAEFSRALGRVLRRPAFLPVPPLALRLKFGAVAQVLTGSQRCVPRAAERAGFAFAHREVEAALRDALGAPGRETGAAAA